MKDTYTKIVIGLLGLVLGITIGLAINSFPNKKSAEAIELATYIEYYYEENIMDKEVFPFTVERSFDVFEEYPHERNDRETLKDIRDIICQYREDVEDMIYNMDDIIANYESIN